MASEIIKASDQNYILLRELTWFCSNFNLSKKAQIGLKKTLDKNSSNGLEEVTLESYDGKEERTKAYFGVSFSNEIFDIINQKTRLDKLAWFGHRVTRGAQHG